MATAEQLVNAGGEVRVDRFVFYVAELPIAGEVGLANRLRALSRKALGPGSLFVRAAPVIDWLREQKRGGDAAVLQRTVSEMVAAGAGDSDDAAEEFRRTPDGVAEELFWRTRATQPDATREEIAAVVNDVNALETHLAIGRALAPKKAATPSDWPN